MTNHAISIAIIINEHRIDVHARISLEATLGVVLFVVDCGASMISSSSQTFRSTLSVEGRLSVHRTAVLMAWAMTAPSGFDCPCSNHLLFGHILQALLCQFHSTLLRRVGNLLVVLGLVHR